MLCRCSGADWKSALLLFPSRGGLLVPNTKPALPRREDGSGVRAPGRERGPGSIHAQGDGFGPRTGAAGADGADAHAEVAADGEIAEDLGDAAFRNEGERVPKAGVEVLAANQDKVAEYRGGKDKLFGFFVGQTMKAMRGQGNPAVVNDILRAKLDP